MENLHVECETLTFVQRDQFTVEQFSNRLKDYFNLFRKQHKMLIALPETTDKQVYLKEVPMATDDSYYHSKAYFKRVLSTFESHPDSTNPAHLYARRFTNRRHELSTVKPPCKRNRHSRLHYLYISSGNQRVPSQQSLIAKVAGETASPNRGS